MPSRREHQRQDRTRHACPKTWYAPQKLYGIIKLTYHQAERPTAEYKRLWKLHYKNEGSLEGERDAAITDSNVIAISTRDTRAKLEAAKNTLVAKKAMERFLKNIGKEVTKEPLLELLNEVSTMEEKLRQFLPGD